MIKFKSNPGNWVLAVTTWHQAASDRLSYHGEAQAVRLPHRTRHLRKNRLYQKPHYNVTFNRFRCIPLYAVSTVYYKTILKIETEIKKKEAKGSFRQCGEGTCKGD